MFVCVFYVHTQNIHKTTAMRHQNPYKLYINFKYLVTSEQRGLDNPSLTKYQAADKKATQGTPRRDPDDVSAPLRSADADVLIYLFREIAF